MLGLGMNEILVIGFVLFDMLVVGIIALFVVTRRGGASRSSGSPGDTQRINELERQVAQLKHQQGQSGAANNAFSSTSPFDSPFGTVSSGGTGDSEILDLLRRGQKIEAIKRYRAMYPHAGLKEAKDAVEAMQRQMGI